MDTPDASRAQRTGKYLPLDDALYAYVLRHRNVREEEPLLQELRRETAALGEIARMQVSAEQGDFLGLLVGLTGARRILEIGTFTGYSTLCMARALPKSGRILCLDVSQEWTDIAQRFWMRAGVADRIELRLGPALESLDMLPENAGFDLVFIDADKEGYDAYFEAVLPRLREGGLMLFDNMLWGGRVARTPIPDASGKAIDALNRKLAADRRVENVLLPIADGLQLCRKL